ncbi:MAG TPA: hypothetical protein EYN06_00415 [Myxococcales bacterium]|nr:hypothetical protein [Myxococcales bacterium]HIN84911.1 hypothetical protein [Myxococcales bacterium]
MNAATTDFTHDNNCKGTTNINAAFASLRTVRHGGNRENASPCKLDFLSDDWTEVSWVTLTEPNETTHRHLVKDSKKFIQRLAEFVGCHIAMIWGLQGRPNTHMHGAICVPQHEAERYSQRIKKFKVSKQWVFRDHHFEQWQPGHGTYTYILEKHFPQEVIWACPKRYARCKKGGSGCIDQIAS